MFENITAAPADPILGLADLFRADDRPEKINLGIGVYKDETGKTPVLTSVKKAEQYLLENETTKNYLGIDGIPEFGRCTQELLFGKGNAIIADKRARTAQTPGGTGALRVAADFLAKNTDVKRVWVSNPSWPNHKSVFTSAGLEVREYAYYDAANHALDFDGLLASLNEAQAGDVVLFHGCCHNPTGIDPTLDQWQQLAQLSVEKGWLPLFDFAYQGFARGLEEDAEGLRAFAALHKELLVASSYSKKLWPVQRARRRLHSGRRGSRDCRPRLQSDEVGDPRQLLEPACAWRLRGRHHSEQRCATGNLGAGTDRYAPAHPAYASAVRQYPAGERREPRLQLYQPAERHVLIQRPD